MQLVGGERDVGQQVVAQQFEVAVRMTVGSDALVHLKDVHPLPRQVVTAKGVQHPRWRGAAAEGERENARCAMAWWAVAAISAAALLANAMGSGSTSTFMSAL